MRSFIFSIFVLFIMTSTPVMAQQFYEGCLPIITKNAYNVYIFKQQGYSLQEINSAIEEGHSKPSDNPKKQAILDALRTTILAMAKDAAFNPFFDPDKAAQRYALRCDSEIQKRFDRLEERTASSGGSPESKIDEQEKKQ